jgi:PII-like signaling protein
VKDRILPPRGEFWMICNGRPFYATYENGKTNYELNGWGFLKEQPEILNELEKCRFYDFSENKLTFICEDKKVKIYEFSFSDFKLKKFDEDLLANLLLNLIRSKYGCILISDRNFEINGETFLRATANCGGKEAVINFNLEKEYLTLPIVTEGGVSNKEKAKNSFRLLNVCKEDFIQEIEPTKVFLRLDCNLGKPYVNYDFQLAMANFLIRKSEFISLFPFLGKYNLQDLAGIKLDYLKKEESENFILRYYLAKDKVIVAKEEKGSGFISEIYFKNEGIR